MRMVKKSDHVFSFFYSPYVNWIALAALFIVAFGIRVYQINEPPLDFHPIRQYRSAIISRYYYYEKLNTLPDWRRTVAYINYQNEGVLEPPVLEWIAANAYNIAGAELIWIPRVLSNIFWLVGGIMIYLIGRKIALHDSAMIATSFYLFLPFGISASRSFQPDPMMIMMLLISLYMIIRYYEKPSRKRLVTAAVLSSIAILIKPVCFF